MTFLKPIKKHCVAVIATTLLLWSCLNSSANLPTYAGAKRWAESHAAIKTQCGDGRVYVMRQFDFVEYAVILCFHDRITLRNIIDSTPDKGKDLRLSIFKKNHDSKPGLNYPDELVIKAGENPNYKIETEDVIMIYPNTNMPKYVNLKLPITI